jgi:hypothetical protein
VGGAVGEAVGNSAASLARAVETYSDRALPAMESLQGLASLPPVLTGAATEAGKAWLELLRRTAESRGRRSLALLHSFTPPQIAQAQYRYVGETMQAWMEANTKMLDISFEAYRSMLKPMERASEAAKETRRGA